MNKFFLVKTTVLAVLLGLNIGVSAGGENPGAKLENKKTHLFDLGNDDHCELVLEWLKDNFETLSGGLRDQFENFCKNFKTYAETAAKGRAEDQKVVVDLKTTVNELATRVTELEKGLKGQTTTSFSDDAWKFFFDGNKKWFTGAAITVATGYVVYKFFFQKSKSKNSEQEEDFDDEE